MLNKKNNFPLSQEDKEFVEKLKTDPKLRLGFFQKIKKTLERMKKNKQEEIKDITAIEDIRQKIKNI